MPNPLELSHAKHDEDTALLVHSLKKSNKWTVVISFYSALHYLRYKLFPLTQITGGVTTIYDSLDDYYSKLPAGKRGMHHVMVALTWLMLPSIAAKYNWLFHTATTARYTNDEIDDRASDQAIKNLAVIKKECLKP